MNNKKIIISVVLLISVIGCSSSSPAGSAVNATGEAVGYVGKTVGNTVKGVGKTIGGAADRLTGNVDVVNARKEIDHTANSTLNRLFKLDRKAKALYDISYGYAIFDSRKSSLIISLGGGAGVAIAKNSNERTYMRMFTGGVNLGAGIQFYQNVFLFENKRSFDNFVNSGWEAGTSANANFGRNALDAQVRFVDGMALFQLADTGINLSVDVTGTKYWKDEDLNK
jgi:lipid-binding SYLF domain-containing protein